MFSVGVKDFLRGLIIAVLVPVFVIIQQSISAGSLIFDWKAIGISALGGLLAYVTKNFFTDGIKQSQATLVDAKISEIKKTEPDPIVADAKIEIVKQNPPTL